MTRRLAGEEEFWRYFIGSALAAAQDFRRGHNAVIVSIVCDRGDRYLSAEFPRLIFSCPASSGEQNGARNNTSDKPVIF